MATFHPRWFLHSVHGRLTLLVVALVAPACLLVAALMYRAYRNEYIAISDKLLATARAAADLVDRELKESDAILRTLSASHSLVRGDLKTFDGVVRTALADDARWFVLGDASMNQLINTRRPFGVELPLIPPNEEFETAMREGRAYISNLSYGSVSGDPVMHVSRPYHVGGRLRYSLTLVLDPRSFSEDINLRRFVAPTGLVSIVDRAGCVVARSRAPEKFVGEPITPALRAMIEGRTEGVRDTVALDGEEGITAFHRARESGWVAFVSVPKEQLVASAREMFVLGLACSGLLLATAGVLAAWILRSVTRGVDSLVAGSEAIARGEPVHFQPSGLTETDFVGSAMARSALHLRQTSEQLKATLDRLHFSLSSLAIGDWEWSANRDQVFMSPRAAMIYGLDPRRREFFRTELRPLIHPDDLEMVRRAAEAATRSGREYRAEYRVNHPELGLRWVAVTGRAAPGSSGADAGLIGVVQDITDLKRAADLLRTQNEELEKRVAERTHRLSETVGELEAFSYSISHDMRAPLRAMHSYAQLLLTEHAAQLTPEALRYLERIAVNAARLELLVRDVLAYRRVAKEQIETKPVDLDSFVRELVGQVGDGASRVQIEIRGNLPRVQAHQAYLSQIFTNLIGNAQKFVAPGVTPQVEVFADNIDGRRVKISVRDNGIGIDAADVPRIFQIFGRLHPSESYDGTGIGLAIVKKAVQRMGGELGVDSVVGKGSTFWFTLPCA